jgi:hypothetical protein
MSEKVKNLFPEEEKTDGTSSKASSLTLSLEEQRRYRQEEQEKGIRYCNIEHKCFNLCEEGNTSCTMCHNHMYYQT